jgi:hypothetical protein
MGRDREAFVGLVDGPEWLRSMLVPVCRGNQQTDANLKGLSLMLLSFISQPRFGIDGNEDGRCSEGLCRL